ncbi:MAG: FlgD immunoglobulin-like domain containing protein [Sandaracinus sp.]
MTTIQSSRSAGQTTNGLGAPTSQTTQSGLDGESFMRLLVAQIRHQDPLQPMDTTQMMAQLTQLTSVERLVAIDDRLGELSIATASVANAQATDLVGRTVEADTSQVILPDAGTATGSFRVDGNAASTRVEIRDANGDVVRTLDVGPHGPGIATFQWDGDDEAGNRLPTGRYRISVTATDADGHAVTTATRLRGEVDAISYDNGYPELEIGESRVLLGDVRSVEDTPADPTTSGTASSTTR